MIRAIPAICLLLALVLFVMWLGGRLERDAQWMDALLEQAEDEVRAEAWAQARDKLRELENLWQGKQPLYRFILEQEVIDGAEGHMSRLRAAAGSEDQSGFFAEAAALRDALESIVQREKISWGAVL